MPLSPEDRVREKRDRKFQTRILAALEKKPRTIRWLVLLNTPIAIWLLSVIFITLGGGYFTAYRQCIDDGRVISRTYSTYKYEIFYRQDAIVKAISQAKTMADLRKALKERIYFNSDLKESIPELLSTYRAAYLRIDRSAVDQSAERKLSASPLSARFTTVFLGSVPDTFTDSDLPSLKLFATLVSYANFLTFLNSLRTIYETRCTPRNVVRIALGESPILLQAIQTTFVEREKHDLHLDSWPIDSLVTSPP